MSGQDIHTMFSMDTVQSFKSGPLATHEAYKMVDDLYIDRTIFYMHSKEPGLHYYLQNQTNKCVHMLEGLPFSLETVLQAWAG